MFRLLLLVSACGRVGFDAAGDGGQLDGATSRDGAIDPDGGTGVPPGVTVVGSSGNGGTMAGVGGGAVGDLRVIALAWNPAGADAVAIADTAGDTWMMPFAATGANDLRFAMYYAIASSASDTITATITPAPSNSAIVVATFRGQGAYFGQGSGNSSNASAAQVIWFPESAGLGVVGIASDAAIGDGGLSPAGMASSNAIDLRILATTATAKATIPLSPAGEFDLGELSFQP